MLTKAMELEKAILEIICYTPNLKKGISVDSGNASLYKKNASLYKIIL